MPPARTNVGTSAGAASTDRIGGHVEHEEVHPVPPDLPHGARGVACLDRVHALPPGECGDIAPDGRLVVSDAGTAGGIKN